MEKGGILLGKPRGKFGMCCVKRNKVYIYLGVQHLWPINANLGMPTPHTHFYLAMECLACLVLSIASVPKMGAFLFSKES